MGTGRMEAFSDGVVAIIITIMVLELKVPHGTDLAALGDRQSELAEAVGRDRKGPVSLIGYAAAIALAFVSPRLADLIYALVAVMWIVPDRRIAECVSS